MTQSEYILGSNDADGWRTEINFVLEELTALNGAMRLVPGSHRWKQRPPNLLEAILRGERDVGSLDGSSCHPCVQLYLLLFQAGNLDYLRLF